MTKEPRYILYVDDNEADFELLSLDLEEAAPKENFKFEHAETVADGIAKFDPGKHHVVLIDWNLPDDDGRVLAAYIRQQGVNTAIIFLSGVFNSIQTERAKPFSPLACLEKGIGDDLAKRVYALLKNA